MSAPKHDEGLRMRRPSGVKRMLRFLSIFVTTAGLALIGVALISTGSASATPVACTATLTANPTTQVVGKDVTLSWVTTGGTPYGLGTGHYLPTSGSLAVTSSTPGTVTYILPVVDNFGNILCESAGVSVVYTAPLNSPPVAVNDSATTNQDTAVTVNVLANDTDPDGDSLTVTGATGASHGTTSVVGNKVVYTPTNGYFGSDSFTYTISDGHGGTASATVNVTVKKAAPSTSPAPSTTPVSSPPVTTPAKSTSPAKATSSHAIGTAVSVTAKSSAVGIPVGETSDSNSSGSNGLIAGLAAIVLLMGAFGTRSLRKHRGRHAQG